MAFAKIARPEDVSRNKDGRPPGICIGCTYLNPCRNIQMKRTKRRRTNHNGKVCRLCRKRMKCRRHGRRRKKRQDFPDDNDGLCVNLCVTTSYTWLNRKAQIWSLLFIAIRFMYARCGRSTFYSSTYRSVLIYICFFSSSLVRRGTTHFVAQLAVKYLTSQFPLLSYSNKNTKLEKKNANWFARHSAEFGIIQ